MIEDSGKKELGLLEKIMLFIQGFKGYKEKELRREMDRLVREAVVRNLDEAEQVFRSALTTLSGPVPEDVMTLIDIIIYRIQRLKDSIRVADSGYSGFFDLVKVREELLDKVLSKDAKLLEVSKKVSKDIKDLSNKGFIGMDTRNRLLMIIEALKVLEEEFRERMKILSGLED